MHRELKRLRDSLTTYITSTYHLSNPALVDMRAELLKRDGTLAQQPYIESTARYMGKRRFCDLTLPPGVADLLSGLGQNGVIFDPPYDHQAEALELALTPPFHDLVVTTGTGSGKTETFLLPILGRLATEAISEKSFEQRALRALLLYPMNALVNDQLGRLRLLFGHRRVARWFENRAGRPMKFARYTGRTLYPGCRREQTDKHRKRLQSLKFYLELERQSATDPEARALIAELRNRGKWPSKPAGTPGGTNGMSSWYGRGRWRKGGRWIRTVERLEDPELFLRQEVHDGVPDLMVTNYSMLEYMLLRPVEREIFRITADYYASNPTQRLVLVLDEAHLYRGAQGTEVAMLIRRLRNRLRLSSEQIQIVCTSASFSDPDAACNFAADLTGKSLSGFKSLTGNKLAAAPSGPGDQATADALASVDLQALRTDELEVRLQAVMPVVAHIAPTENAPIHVVGTAGTDVDLRCVTSDVEVINLDFQLSTESEELPDGVIAVIGGTSTAPINITVGSATELRISELSRVQLESSQDPIARLLHSCLSRLPVAGRLRNLTSGAHSDGDGERDDPGVGPAQAVNTLGSRLFPAVDSALARKATENLIELASTARCGGDPPLFPARIHMFFRGLPGLWACADPMCSMVPIHLRDKWGGELPPTGILYPQPRRNCECGARVFEIHTCRDCGTAFFRAFAFDPEDPEYLWTEEMEAIDENVGSIVKPVHLLLEEPPDGSGARFHYLDPFSGRLGSGNSAAREVWLSPSSEPKTPPGMFGKCPCCGSSGPRNISDHVTKGDQPFQEIISTQLLEQPPRAGVHTPLRGRKSLVFSDGRQAASRLAGRLQQYSMQDAVRPLLLAGFAELKRRYSRPVALDHSYASLLCGCALHGVNLRPIQGLHFVEDLGAVRELLESNPSATELEFFEKSGEFNHLRTNKSLMHAVYPVLNDRHTGLSALALAAIRPKLTAMEERALARLPLPPEPSLLDDHERRLALLDLWVADALSRHALYLPTTPNEWLDSQAGATIRRVKGGFPHILKDLIGSRWFNANLRMRGGNPPPWVQFVTRTFGVSHTANGFVLRAAKLCVIQDGISWRRCEKCSSVQPENPLAGDRCTVRRGNQYCSGKTRDLDPVVDPVFISRKGHYRRHVERLASEPGYSPHPFVAAEHSAALNASGDRTDVARAEWHELRFQDLDVVGPEGCREGPIDVLSCTTTMEVGIDIGSLTAVALRNVPPGRANYQQRAGRAGRRGSALSTVITYCGADSHDQQFYADPVGMVSGPVPVPTLNLDNFEIVRRHCFALLMSLFQQHSIPDLVEGREIGANVFESLGTLRDFRRGNYNEFSYNGLESWLSNTRFSLVETLAEIVPINVRNKAPNFIDEIPELLLAALRGVGAGPLRADEIAVLERPSNEGIIDEAIGLGASGRTVTLDWGDGPDLDPGEDIASENRLEETPEQGLDPEKLLDRLFDRGVLPRYAFPTDVVTFHVFDMAQSTERRAKLKYTPQLGLNQALSSYAPGREIWVNGERHYSFAVWTPFKRRDCWQAWKRSKVYFECSRCGYARVERSGDSYYVGQVLRCPACGTDASLGVGRQWIRPPGFAHPVDIEAELPHADSPTPTRSTRAKLSAPFTDTASASASKTAINGAGYDIWTEKQQLVLTNTGSRDPWKPGFLHCPRCGRTEPNGWAAGNLRQGGGHPKPFPDHHPHGAICNGYAKEVVFGNEFETDIGLIRFRLAGEARLAPGSAVANIVLTTVAEVLSAVSAKHQDIEESDIGAEYRVAMTEGGRTGREVEVYLYDLTPGGAGFVRSAVADSVALFETALERLEDCSCTHSCYECLRSYKNRWDHKRLHRTLGAAFLRHVVCGELPTIPAVDEIRLLRSLAADLGESGHRVEEVNGGLRLGDLERYVVLGHPLIPRRPGSVAGRELALVGDVHVVDSLVVDQALPAAVRAATGVASAAPEEPGLPGFLREEQGGCPVFSVSMLGSRTFPRPVGTVRVGGAPPGAYVVQLTRPTLERMPGGRFACGAWVVCVPTQENAFVRDTNDRFPRLLVRDNGAFNATGERWSFGRPTEREEKVHILYYSYEAPRSEMALKSEVRVIGKAIGVFVDEVLQSIH